MIATHRTYSEPADKSSLGLMGVNDRPKPINNKSSRLASINLDDSTTDYSTPDTDDVDDEFDISHGAHHRYAAEEPRRNHHHHSSSPLMSNYHHHNHQYRQRSSGGSSTSSSSGSGGRGSGNGHSSRWLTMNGMIAEYQHSQDNYNIAACALVERGEEKTPLQGFVEDRVTTFNNNINYAQHQAEELAKNIAENIVEEVQDNQVTCFVQDRINTFTRNWEIISTDWFGNIRGGGKKQPGFRKSGTI